VPRQDILKRLSSTIDADTPARYPEVIAAAMSEIKQLRSLYDAGSEIYCALVGRETTAGQKEAILDFAKFSNSYHRSNSE